MRFFNRIRMVLALLMALLGATSVLLPSVMRITEEAVDRTGRHDIAWNGLNGRNEFQEMLFQIMAHAIAPDDETRERTRLAYEIFVSRLGSWNQGVFGEFVRESPRRQESLLRVEASIAESEARLQSLDDPQTRTTIIALLKRIEPDVERIGREAYTASTQQIAANTDRLRQLQNLQQGAIIALVATGFLLTALLFWQNRLLKSAHKAEKAASAENAYLATHDPLTQLPNRSSLHEALEQALANAGGQRSPALLVVDLDGFKPINDVLGHRAGDQLLMSVGRRLGALSAGPDQPVAARFGGDEFVILYPALAGKAEAIARAEAILHVLREPHKVDDHSVTIDASIGIALYDGTNRDPIDLLNRADIALNTAKSAGKGIILMFEPVMATGIVSRQKLETELAEADAWAEFVPYYQPLVDIVSGEIIGVEALARWHHPVRGMVSPAEFIPAAERSGRIVEIGRIMIEKACRDALRFPRPIAVSVNLSPVQLMRIDVAKLIGDTLRDTHLPPERLKLELTESVMINDTKASRELVSRLQAMGVVVSLDDFGTGYSSLSYLRRFDFDEIKIDRTFITDLDQDRQALAIVQTIVALARNLDMKVIAEGIETEEQAKLVLACGCARGQGFLFGRPLPFDRVMEMLAVPKTQVARKADRPRVRLP